MAYPHSLKRNWQIRRLTPIFIMFFSSMEIIQGLLATESLPIYFLVPLLQLIVPQYELHSCYILKNTVVNSSKNITKNVP